MKQCLLATAALAALQFAAPQGAYAADNADAQVDEVIVTGTRAAGRTVATASAPIDVLGAAALERTATMELGQAIQRVAPSFNLPQSVVGTTGAIRSATLRGLAPDQALVLINGKRRHSTSAVNTNNSIGRGSVATDFAFIPLAAVERTEVLRDGASAQYGSDAIAGVINIILRSEDEGSRLTLRARKTQRSDGLGGQAAISTGMLIGDGGSLTLTGEVMGYQKTNTALPNFNGTPTTNPNYGKVVGQFGDPRAAGVLATANLVLPLGGEKELYGHATAGYRNVLAPGFFRDPIGAGGPTAAAPDNKLIFPNGFLPIATTEQWDGEVYAGVRGEFANGWRWDVSTGLGRNVYDQTLERGVNGSLGAASPTKFGLGGFEYLQWTSGVELSHTYDLLDGLDVTVGADHRYEAYKINPGDKASRFDLGSDPQKGLDPVRPIDESRNSYAVFVDSELNFSDAFRVGGALRYENYSDFGGTLTGKLSSYFKATDWLSLRGSVSTGFRAPSLQQTFYTTVNRRFADNLADALTLGTFPVESPAALAVGAKPLEAEKSKQFSAGVVLRPIPDLLVTVDYFQTKVEDRITLSDQLSALGTTPGALAVRKALDAAGIKNVNAISFFTNAVDTTTRGVEIAADYTIYDVFGGRLGVAAAYTHFSTRIDRLKANSVVPQLPLLGGRSLTLLTKSQPEDKASVDLNFKRGPLTLSALATYYGKYTVNFGEDIPIGDEVVFDLSAAFQVRDNVQISVGVQNLFDEYPDVVAEKAPTLGARVRQFALQYPEESPFGANGRTFSISLTAEF